MRLEVEGSLTAQSLPMGCSGEHSPGERGSCTLTVTLFTKAVWHLQAVVSSCQ